MKKLRILFLLLFLFPYSIHAEELSFAEHAKSAIMIEASTGEVLFEKNADEKLAPASMTKMMSMLLLVESVEKGIIHWDDIVTISENASSMGGSQILLETNEKMSVDDLFKGIAVASGNDAVVAIAEYIAGTEKEFVKMMNEKAKSLGLQNTNFKNPHGLDESDHYSSARDMALIAKELVSHPKVLEYTSIYEDYLRENTDRKIWLVNTNKLVRFYDGVDGLKTGYTEPAGYCLTATAKRNGMRIITVVMGEPDSKTRNAETTSMLDYAFAQYETETILSKDRILGTIEVEKGKQKYVNLIPLREVSLLNKKGEKKKEASYQIKVQNVKAPIKKGEEVGTIEIQIDGKSLKGVPITVEKDIQKANLLELYGRNLSDIFSGSITVNESQSI